MAAHHPSPPMGMMHHGPPGPPPPPGVAPAQQWAPSRQILAMNEAVWVQIGKCIPMSKPSYILCLPATLANCYAGSFSELLGNLDDAMAAYEHALRANPNSIQAMNSISLILRTREEFGKAVDYLQAILKIDATNGEAWGSLGHCYLMMDDLQQAYAAYQSALVNLRNPKVCLPSYNHFFFFCFFCL